MIKELMQNHKDRVLYECIQIDPKDPHLTDDQVGW